MLNRLLVDAMAILSALLDTPGHKGIARYIYIVLGSDRERYSDAVGVLEQLGFVKATPETVTLTDTGIAKAKEVNAMVGS